MTVSRVYFTILKFLTETSFLYYFLTIRFKDIQFISFYSIFNLLYDEPPFIPAPSDSLLILTHILFICQLFLLTFLYFLQFFSVFLYLLSFFLKVHALFCKCHLYYIIYSPLSTVFMLFFPFF